ncbi:MAG: hypothetical protein MRERC_2c090 [Mycoplasmataceae bacterium RC_NB112A]|nr:MAG: hypothetical protein MRERC_2c090 [Mycoplasmataceae bacterium RC_NB112A]
MIDKITCCQINTIYLSLGFQTGYYYLFKDLKEKGFLCEKCVNFSRELGKIYLDFREKVSKHLEN